jgi:hypothetical protein
MLNRMRVIGLQDFDSQVRLFFAAYLYCQDAAARPGGFCQLHQDIPLDRDIAPQDPANLFELATVLSRSIYLPGCLISGQVLHIINIEASVPQCLHYLVSTFRLIYGSYQIVANKPTSLKVWLIIPHVLPSCMVDFLLKTEGHTTWSGCKPLLSKLTLPTYRNPNVLGQDMSGITALETNNIFTIGFMAKIKVSFTFGTCLKQHSTPPHYLIAGKSKVLLDHPFGETVHILPVPGSSSFSPGSNMPKSTMSIKFLLDFMSMGLLKLSGLEISSDVFPSFTMNWVTLPTSTSFRFTHTTLKPANCIAPVTGTKGCESREVIVLELLVWPCRMPCRVFVKA